MRSILTAAATIAMLVQSAAASAQSTFVVRDVRLFDGEHVAEYRSVIVRDGVIAQIGDARLPVPIGAHVIVGRRRTLLPGLIDAHVHMSDSVESNLRQSLAVGVTTDLDMWSGGARLDQIKALRAADAPDVADVRTAGIGATAQGGHPSQMGGGSFPTISDASEAQAFVDARIAEGSNYVKIIYDDLASLGMKLPMLDKRTLKALVDAAHARGKLAVVHITSEAQARDAIEAGADGLAHLFIGATVSSDFATLAASHHVFVVPTLTVLYGECGEAIGARIANDSLLRPYIRPAVRNQAGMTLPPMGGKKSCEGTRDAVRQLARAGVPLLTGTDSPAPGQTYGASVHGELQLLVAAGLTPVQALTGATSAAARAFRLTDRGTIAPGKRGDLVLVDGDPTTDITATRRIVEVWKKGVAVKRERFAEQ